MERKKKHHALWSELTAATRIQKLPDYLVVYVDGQKTSIVWGGALAGHWGVIIYSGKDNAKDGITQFRNFQRLPVAGDIDVFISSD